VLDDVFRSVVDEDSQQSKTAPEINPVNTMGGTRRH
jgi:hypothetical protein